VGIPAILKVRAFGTPNINRLADDGINFMRRYIEPACTPTGSRT
jgi:arylsulfatase A-like enzyme